MDCDRPGREITTADHLAAAVFRRDSKLMRGETARDYGYFRVRGGSEESKVLDNIWTEVFLDIGIKPVTLHKWRIEGRIHAELIATYQRTPRKVSEVNFSWLREHPEVFDPEAESFPVKETGERIRLQVWTHIGGSPDDSLDDIERKVRHWPSYKKRCLHFYGMVFLYGGPLVGQTNAWINFGFCALALPIGVPLRHIYRDLIFRCTFEESARPIIHLHLSPSWIDMV